MKLSIKEIIELKTSVLEDGWIDLGVFEDQGIDFINSGTWNYLSDDLKKRITCENKMADYCNDGRSRSVVIMSIDGVPFFFYQYVGKGYYENKLVLSKTHLFEFVAECMKCYVGELEFQEVNEDHEINIVAYGAKSCNIEDGTLTTRM